MINVRVGSGSGPLVPVLSSAGGQLILGYSSPIAAGTPLYSEDGTTVIYTVTSSGEADVASLMESRSVQQVLDEDGPSGPYDFGWRFVHQGWLVNFENGKVLFGDLTAKNQNRENVGTQGPTPIDGSNGSPLILTQRVSITNGTVQVNGWKSSSTPTTYVLDPNDVTALDATYAYADAYVTWDGTTGEVTAPGSNGAGLVEYPATNTVPVEV